MNNFRHKLKDILLRHIYVAIGVTLVHLLFYYCLVLKFEINIRDIASKYILPAMLTIAAVIIWVSPGIERLKFKNERIRAFYYLISVSSTFWLCLASANLLTIVINNNIIIDNVSEIGTKPHSIYYTIRHHNLSKDHFGYSTQIEKHRSRKGRKGYTSITIYCALPICNNNMKIKDISNYKYWIMNTFNIQKSLNVKTEDIDNTIADFTNWHKREFLKATYQINPNHFERIRYPEGIDYMRSAINKVTSQTPKNLIILKPCYSNLPEKIIYVRQIFISFFSGIIVLFLLLVFPKYRVNKIGLV